MDFREHHRVDDTAKKFQRATCYKIFLTNPSLRSALFSPLQPTDDGVGSMVETAIFAQWLHRDWFTPHFEKITESDVELITIRATV